MQLSRRKFLLGAALLIPACRSTSRADSSLVPTPFVPDEDGPTGPMPLDRGGNACTATADQIEGPFYKAGAPSRATLVTDRDNGERLLLTGMVLSTQCKPLANATLDIWHADARGGYDNDGWGLRGTLVTDALGRYSIRTLVPGRYLNGKQYRPSHIHVKIRAPRDRGSRREVTRAELTTQLYFDGDPYIDGDPFVVSSLIMAHRRDNGVRKASFDFVI
jgi:protocatechuate 3,4-dioxygenase beta subunit